MDIDIVKNFVVVAYSSSFSQAAKRLGCSQQVVSNSVAQLERYLGNALFERSTLGCVLTPFGAICLDAAKDVASSMEHLRRLGLDFEREEACGSTLRVGVSATAARHVLARGRLPDEFRRLFPGISFYPLACSTGDGLSALDDDRLDALVFGSVRSSRPLRRYQDFEAHFIAGLPVSAVVSREDPLAKCSTLSLEDLRARPFVSHTHNDLVKLTVIEGCRHHGFIPAFIDSPSQSGRDYWDSLASGRAVSLLHAWPACPSEHPQCAFVPLKDAKRLELDLYLAYRRQAARGELMELGKLLASAFKPMEKP